jgi:hypothetical protein
VPMIVAPRLDELRRRHLATDPVSASGPESPWRSCAVCSGAQRLRIDAGSNPRNAPASRPPGRSRCCRRARRSRGVGCRSGLLPAAASVFAVCRSDTGSRGGAARRWRRWRQRIRGGCGQRPRTAGDAQLRALCRRSGQPAAVPAIGARPRARPAWECAQGRRAATESCPAVQPLAASKRLRLTPLAAATPARGLAAAQPVDAVIALREVALRFGGRRAQPAAISAAGAACPATAVDSRAAPAGCRSIWAAAAPGSTPARRPCPP